MSAADAIKKVAVLGAGTMGHGIAQVSAAAGCSVVLYDVDEAAVRKGLDRIEGNLDKGVSLGKVSPEAKSAIFERLSSSTSIPQAVDDADLVIEAAPEKLELKQAIFREVEESAPGHAILATNSSSLSIGKIASAVPDPTRVVGMHFFNPVHIMVLVEVVWGPETADEVRDAAAAFARRMGKEPIIVKDSPGFASSRLGLAMGIEAIRMLQDGVASAEDIDKAMELGYRHPMGPLKLTDLVGLDVRLGIAEYLHEALHDGAFEPPELLRRMVAEGKLGKKTGQGFYDWTKS